MRLRFNPFRSAIVGSALSGLAWACGGGQTRAHPFERSWSDESGAELAAFVARWRRPEAPPVPGLLVGAREGVALVGAALGSRPWRLDFPVEGQPFLAGRIAVAVGGGELVAADATTGAVLWRLPVVGTLRGASDDGATTLVSVESLSGRRSQVLAVSRDGTVVRQLLEDGLVGAPLVVDAYAFLPVSGAILVFDLVAGLEVARVVSTSPLERAFAQGDEILFGGEHVLRFDAAVAAARGGGGTRARLPDRFLPGAPRWRQVPEGGAVPRAFLVARPTGETVSSPVFVEGPILVGLEPRGGAVRWVHTGTSPFVGARALLGGTVACDTAGDAVVLGDDGEARARWRVEGPVDRCDAVHGALSSTVGDPRHALPFGLATALAEPRPSMLGLQLFLVDELAALATPFARSLLEELARRRIDPGDSPEHAAARLALARLAASRLERFAPRSVEPTPSP